ncbi:MAG: MoxR family ATPase, partial [Haliea sp.]|uniref:AAA family ATPase n=1 Tax=Haliea sp. TaxID=1932666 RepID=UPI0032ECEB57
QEKLGDPLQGAQGLAASLEPHHHVGDMVYPEQFLEPRPLLTATQQERGAILLIDEVDKSDYEFESLLLEILSDYQVSIPEIGTVKASVSPMVFLTSNNTRDISDALKRRCLHLYIPFPSVELEERIVLSRVPDIDRQLRQQLVAFVHSLRDLDLKKTPAISETIDWARSLLLLHARELDPEIVHSTLNVLLKFEDDIDTANAGLRDLLPRRTA